MKRLLSLGLFRLGCWLELLGTPKWQRPTVRDQQDEMYRALRLRWGMKP